MKAIPAALLLLLLCAAGSASAQGARLFPRLGCANRTPAVPTNVKGTGVNGRLEVTWNTVPCSTIYQVSVERLDVKVSVSCDLSSPHMRVITGGPTYPCHTPVPPTRPPTHCL